MMEATEADDARTDAPTLNGITLTDVDAVEDALDYLSEPYNTGNLVRTLDGDGLLVTSRNGYFQHLDTLQDADAIEVADVRAVTHEGEARLLLQIEDADTEGDR